MLSAVDAVVGFTTIKRKIWISDRGLNLTARLDAGRPRLDFNYHHDAKNAEDASAHLENHVVALKASALGFAEKVYGLSVEAT